ncbi:MAG: septal ring lytic transglycosylase RlpA family protein [Firmicutes bacterium]|nr:septal ring lytic transglycosylase RlpA family protein [Bacillota bacterium]
MIGSGSFTVKAGQLYVCFLALAAAFGGLSALENLCAAEKAAVESCDSSLERNQIALGRTGHQQKLLVCPPPPRKIERSETPPSREGRAAGEILQGLASWYGGSDGINGGRTASGERFDPSAYTAAHRSLPFGTRVRVTYLRTGQSTVVRINDRGPFSSKRIIDISRAAAAEIGLQSAGVGAVSLEILP